MRNITRITPCCKPPVERINSMPADCNGDFSVKAGAGIAIITETNGIRIKNTGGSGIDQYTNTDGNINIDNLNYELNLSADVEIANDLKVDGKGTFNTLVPENGTEIRVDGGLDINGNTTVTGDIGIQGYTNIAGTLNVGGDIIQQGSVYETHAQQIYTADDYIVMRDGAVGGLSTGNYSGFAVNKYDGTNTGRLVIDNTGTARVGDMGDEQPLMTRDEIISDGALLKWDSTNKRAVREGTVGSDTKPIKIVNGVATMVNFDLVSTEGDQIINGLKKFTDRMGIQAGNAFARMSGFYVSTSYMGFDQAVGKDDDENTYGGLRVVFNHDNKTVSLELIKVVNGVFSSQGIANL